MKTKIVCRWIGLGFIGGPAAVGNVALAASGGASDD